jgi:hypothetical protein
MVREVQDRQPLFYRLATFFTKRISNNYFRGTRSIPRDIVKKEIIVPTAPNNVIVMKFLKNCFFFTWKLMRNSL